MVRSETYRDLCHGTHKDAANKIISEGFLPSTSLNSWCGSGIYFYDIKAKAWWSASRTCEDIKRQSGKRVKPVVIFADIIGLPKSDIVDLRSPSDFADFEEFSSELLASDNKFEIDGVDNDEERIIALRAMLIDFYATKAGKKLIVGLFKQREQPLHGDRIKFANRLNLILGVETIYCVRDASILQNIRQGGETK